ncbi:zinc finger CCCH domain-containing protein 13-like [Megalops cyprinoides]|uniref:zinc finger CCCH domain-containing protein 13-like n=1 Tax=Megalops cyprinoides TaxID=118141 RepID=UPI0018650B22|nr:zinc finger CCCH domain-containing protein 13-like [Megalops cyprinoides]
MASLPSPNLSERPWFLSTVCDDITARLPQKPGPLRRRLTSRQVLTKEMAAQVEVKTGEGARAGGVGARLHLSPLTDSSNKSPIEAPSGTQSPLILAPEPSKPVPGPKPRLTPKPFAVEKNPTIRPIPAPKPTTKPRPEPTRPASYKPDPPTTPKPTQPKPTNAGAQRPVSTTPKRPTPTSLKPAPKPALAQTPKPAVQPRKPALPPAPGEPAKLTLLETSGPQGAGAGAGPARPRGPQQPLAAEWSGTTKREVERRGGKERGGASITRAKSMGFLNQAGQEAEKSGEGVTGGGASEAPVPMRPQPRASRPRPVSAIFTPAPTQAESPDPGPSSRWAGRRPLSADLTAKFESIGLSLHRRPGKADSKENTPERPREDDGGPTRRKEKGAEPASSAAPERKPKPSVPERKPEEKKEQQQQEEKEKEEERSGGSIKRRISLLFDSSSSPGGGLLSVAGTEPRTPAQPVSETDIPVGVKQRIKKLTEDTPPAQTPSPKTAFKPRPLPSDLTKRFATEKPAELSSPSPSSSEKEGSRGHLQDDGEAQGKLEEPAVGHSDQAKEGEEGAGLAPQIPQDPAHAPLDQSAGSMEEAPEKERRAEREAQEACPSGGVQTVRAALFENVVERHSVRVVEEGGGGEGRPRRSVSVRQREPGERVPGGVTLQEPASPASPLRVEHIFDTVPAVGERRAVSESVPSAQLEDKAMTLRSRRSGGDGLPSHEPEAEGPGQATVSGMQGPLAPSPDQTPRYLRVGALMNWFAEETERNKEREAELEAERERDREAERQRVERARQVELEKERVREMDRERQREWEREREEVAAPKRLKILEGEDQAHRPRATYFALTGQMQEPMVQEEGVEERGAMEVPFEDFSVKPGRWSSQGKVVSVCRNPSLDADFGKTPPGLEVGVGGEGLPGRGGERKSESEKEQEIKMLERQRTEREREAERQKMLEFERQREREREREEMERQRELERQRQEVERQRELERQRQEVERQRELERQRQEMERQRELERQRV